MTAAVTAQQQKVFDFMVAFYVANDQLPGAPIIASAFGYASNNAASEHVLRLAAKGLLEKNEAGNYRFSRNLAHPGWRAVLPQLNLTRTDAKPGTN